MSAVRRWWVYKSFLHPRPVSTRTAMAEVVEAAAYEALEKEVLALLEWKFALQGLTPSGSEFCDVKSCEEWVRKARTSQHEYLLTEIKTRKQLQRDLATVQGERDRLRKALEVATKELVTHAYCGDAYPEDGWPEVQAALHVAQAALAQPAAPSAPDAVFVDHPETDFRITGEARSE